ncbi:hypothetical protein GCWU000282_00061 [Catonella morbi ATCC 51271]|jgi:hypothetical protein|uniref:Uncharacterized protein n=1 Tax=Catonella morbi ATCC 51271 TaxID=592026 RepID=V2XR78_9FIRM|nr:hypothetical protein [Catonella morbi]ESL04674.1 hypothetical protein GCWU000282_00061 [Catonella morbi ATCC 51271]
MIVKDKVSLMSKMAIFEKSPKGKAVLRDISFFRADRIRWDLLKTGASVTVGYALVLGLIILYNLEYLIKNATTLNYKDIGIKTLGVYLVVMVVYLVFTFLYSTYRYGKSRKKFLKYNKLLSKLESIYDNELEEESK